MDKISVIIPVYNNEKFLARCFDSVINQTYQNLEIILINDGSTDNSLKICKKYSKKDNRIKLIDKKNEGVSVTRNLGISKASGDYITFVDSDDFLVEDAIENMYKAMVEYNVDVVRSNYQVFYTGCDKNEIGNLGEIGNKKLNSKEIRDILIPKFLSGDIPCFTYLLLIKRSLLKSNILFPIDIHMMEDVVFYIRLFLNANSVYMLDEFTYNIFFNEDGITNNKRNYERNILNVIDVGKYITDILDNNNLNSQDNIICLNSNHCNALADFIFKQYLFNDDFVSFCKRLSNNEEFVGIYRLGNEKINIQRKILLYFIVNKRYMFLMIYCYFRKVIHNIKRRLG